MLRVIDKNSCCGCTACSNSCPKNCISFINDKEGFLYPHIDEKKCINCGLCERVCPEINKRNNITDLKKSFVVRDNRMQILKISTAGGVYSSFMEEVINSNGVVYGVILSDDFKVVHCRIDSLKDPNIIKVPGSKYVQSSLNDTFKRIKHDLINDKLVCFSGTPCQINGLKNYLNKDYFNLITIDFLCHGVSSPLVWDKYLENKKIKYNSIIQNVVFRNKTYDYYHGTMKISFNNGKKYFGSLRTDLFLRAYYSNISLRPSCYNCKFRTLERCSDITLFDCFHPSSLNSEVRDDCLGFTNVCIHTNKGLKLFNNCNDKLQTYTCNFEQSLKNDGVMASKQITIPSIRNDFFKLINEGSFDESFNNLLGINFKEKFIENIKSLIWKKEKDDK